MRLRAPAKLNLTLEVGPRLENGYHVIASIMIPIQLADELELALAPPGVLTLDVVSEDDGAAVAAGEENLAWRAARRLQEEAEARGISVPGVRMRLRKRIPVAAGLGGGSADAAATLLGLNRLWQLHWPEDALARIGARLGADIPFCILSRPALVEGFGELYTPLSDIPLLPLVIVNPRRPLLTGDVYARYDRQGDAVRRPGRKAAAMIRALHGGRLEEIAAALYNDLARPAEELAPEIGEIRRALTGAGALGTQVAGSGPTVFGIAADLQQAEAIAEACRRLGAASGGAWWTWVGWGGRTFGQRIEADQTRQLQTTP